MTHGVRNALWVIRFSPSYSTLLTILILSVLSILSNLLSRGPAKNGDVSVVADNLDARFASEVFDVFNRNQDHQSPA